MSNHLQKGLTKNDEMRGENSRATGVYISVHEDSERIFNKAYRVFSRSYGFSMIELMVGLLVGLILSFAVVQVYVSQTQSYKTAYAQAAIQSAENAIANLVVPIIRSAGFAGCGSLLTAISNLNTGGPNPIATLNTTSTFITGYDGGTSGVSITSNAANDNNASHWTPSLDTTLVGSVERYSDVLIVLGPAPDALPISVTTIDSGSNSLTLQGTNGSTLSVGQFGAVSDCAQSIVFKITGISGSTLAHLSGAQALENSSSTLALNFNPGAQFISLQQSAFFVGQGDGGESALMLATLNGSNWTTQALVPGVEIMKVQYGIGTSGTITQYVSAGSVTDWTQVYAVRLGFLIAGKQGSGPPSAAGQYTVLDTAVTVPMDTRVRHVFEVTIQLRNSVS